MVSSRSYRLRGGRHVVEHREHEAEHVNSSTPSSFTFPKAHAAYFEVCTESSDTYMKMERSSSVVAPQTNKEFLKESQEKSCIDLVESSSSKGGAIKATPQPGSDLTIRIGVNSAVSLTDEGFAMEAVLQMPEVLELIFIHLDVGDLLSGVAQTCRLFKKIVKTSIAIGAFAANQRTLIRSSAQNDADVHNARPRSPTRFWGHRYRTRTCNQEWWSDPRADTSRNEPFLHLHPFVQDRTAPWLFDQYQGFWFDTDHSTGMLILYVKQTWLRDLAPYADSHMCICPIHCPPSSGWLNLQVCQPAVASLEVHEASVDILPCWLWPNCHRWDKILESHDCTSSCIREEAGRRGSYSDDFKVYDKKVYGRVEIFESIENGGVDLRSLFMTVERWSLQYDKELKLSDSKSQFYWRRQDMEHVWRVVWKAGTDKPADDRLAQHTHLPFRMPFF